MINTLPLSVRLLAMLILGSQTVLECDAQSVISWIPDPSLVEITPQTNGETVEVTVTVGLPDSGKSLGWWGQPRLAANQVFVDSQFWTATNTIVLPIFTEVSMTYDLGVLSPGTYSFSFGAWRVRGEDEIQIRTLELVTTQAFSVPLLLSIRAPQDESQVQLCWNTGTSAWYRVEYSSTPATNQWAPLTAWLPGTGNRFCTNDVVLLGRRQRFYRIIGTNAPPF